MVASDLVNGVINGAIDFDGSNDEIVISHDESLDVGSSNHTVESFVYLNGTDTAYVILAKRPYLSSTIDYNYYVDGSNLKLGSYNGSTAVYGNTALSLNQWHHVAFVYVNGILYFYLDGQPDGFQAQVSSAANSHDVYIGSDNGYNWGYFKIDEVRLHKRAVEASRIKANNYNFRNSLISFGDTIYRPTFVFTGYVQVYSIPAQRTVLLYRRSTGELVGTTTSDPNTGYFEIPGAYSDYHFVVILPLLTEEFNLLGKDRLHPSV
jgi:hypothetical protein